MESRPPWLTTAQSLIGTREAAGPANNPIILDWANKLSSSALGIDYDEDAIPWCGLFVAHCIASANISPPNISVRASSWALWGRGVDECAPGAILVFRRPGGGHVGFYVGEDADAFHVLGGNQADAVNIMRIAKSRCVAKRWPSGVAMDGGRVIAVSGAHLSVDEG